MTAPVDKSPAKLLINGVPCVPIPASEMEFSFRPAEENERLTRFVEVLLGRRILGAYRRRDGAIIVREFGDIQCTKVDVTFTR